MSAAATGPRADGMRAARKARKVTSLDFTIGERPQRQNLPHFSRVFYWHFSNLAQ
jgi:hypothetical protein